MAWAETRTWKEMCGGERALEGYRADNEMAFRQCPKDPDQADRTLEITWDPDNKKVVVVDVYGQPFGGALSQFNYVRDPAAMVAIARSLLKIAVAHYTDDA